MGTWQPELTIEIARNDIFGFAIYIMDLAIHSLTGATMTTQREPTADEQRGIEWWNALDEDARRYWMRQAKNSGRAADAWEACKQARETASGT